MREIPFHSLPVSRPRFWALAFHIEQICTDPHSYGSHIPSWEVEVILGLLIPNLEETDPRGYRNLLGELYTSINVNVDKMGKWL